MKESLRYNAALKALHVELLALRELAKKALEALKGLAESCTITYESQAEKYLKEQFRGKSRVWSDYECWLYPGDCIYEVSKEDIDKVAPVLSDPLAKTLLGDGK